MHGQYLLLISVCLCVWNVVCEGADTGTTECSGASEHASACDSEQHSHAGGSHQEAGRGHQDEPRVLQQVL